MIWLRVSMTSPLRVRVGLVQFSVAVKASSPLGTAVKSWMTLGVLLKTSAGT